MLAIKQEETKRQMRDLSEQKVVVIGAARQGIALARYLVRQGAHVVLNDHQPIDQLAAAMQTLDGEPIEWVCGGHPLSLLDDVDMVCISGGVPFDLPIVITARERGIEISNDSQIFLEVCPCRVIGITGSAGKTTTTTLVGLIADAAIDEMTGEIGDLTIGGGNISEGANSLVPDSKAWVGGNIGTPLLTMVAEMQPHDLAVMELSSFQLEVMERSPEIAAILNITPNHLDRHVTMQAYKDVKARILQFQSSKSVAILNQDDPHTWSLEREVKGRLITFGINKTTSGQESVYLSSDGELILLESPSIDGGNSIPVMRREEIPLRGDHNLLNVLAACAISLAAELPISAMASGVRRFSGIPHRLEFVRQWGGGDWYNDSIATAPERAVAAINSFSEPLILLAGGRDKDLPWDGFASVVTQRVKHLILFGEAVGLISKALTCNGELSAMTVTVCSGLKEAVEAAAVKVSPGDVVLLSPGGTSFDEFHDFEDRGEEYKQWVMELP